MTKKKEKQQGLKLKHRPKVVAVTEVVAAAADLPAAVDKDAVSRAVAAAKEVAAVVAGDNNHYAICRL
jgi:hypothetical protein